MASKPYQLEESGPRSLLSAPVRDRTVLPRLREESAGRQAGGMPLSPEQGQFMQFLVRTLEIGTCEAIQNQGQGRPRA